MTPLPLDYQDKMNSMISGNRVAADSTNKIIEQIQSQMDSIQEEIDTISNYVNTKIANDLESYLIGTTYPSDIHIMSKGSLFNKSSDDDGNLTDWSVLILSFDNDSSSSDHFTIISPNTLRCNGNKISLFTKCPTGGYDIAIAKRNIEGSFDSIRFCNINETYIDATSDDTYVILSGNYLTDQTLCFTLRAYYNHPVDSRVSQYISDWGIGHDYIVKDFDSDYAYGLKAKKNMLNKAKKLMINNQTKFSSSADTWKKY